jgi:signal transduction histidine kinase
MIAMARQVDQRLVDLALAVALFLTASAIGALYTPPGWRLFDPLAYVLTAVTFLPLAVRRVAPGPALVVSAAGYAAYLYADYALGVHMWGPVLAFYSLAGARPFRTTAMGALLVAAVVSYGGTLVPDFHVFGVVFQTVGVVAAAWVLGGLSRQLDERNRQLAELTRQLRHEQEQRTERELARERLRIARELHDVVAHHMSVMSMQAGLADYVFDSDPPTARAAVNTVGRTGREALEEMRRLLTLLRTADTQEHEPAGLDSLPVLFDRVRAAGVALDTDVDDGTAELPSGLQMTVYRVVQEALTNVIKYAAPCRAAVSVRCGAQELVVTVVNDGERVTSIGEGHGLLGIRERARMYHGNVTAEPRPEGGFLVALTIPRG